MKVTDILMNEHRVIEQVLNCLEAMANTAARNGRLDDKAARQAVDFFRHFADRCHHGKEETHLFTWMEAHGFSRDVGPTGVMLHEHEQGRTQVQGMEQAIDQAAQGNPAALQQFITHARYYIALLREHIDKEDHCLFPMAANAMSEKDAADLELKFEKTEAEDMGAGAHEKYLRIADALAEQYHVSKAQIDHHSIKGCCHH